MRFFQRRSVIVLTTLFLVLALILVAGISFIFSRSGSAFILTKTKTLLKTDFQTDLNYREGQLYLLHGLQFKDLTITGQMSSFKIDVKIPSIDINYDFGLFPRKLTVKEFNLDHPSIAISLNLKDSAKKETNEKKTEPGFDLKKIEDLLRHPPALLEVQNLLIDKLDLNFSLHSPSKDIVLQLKDFHLQSHFELKPSHIVLNSKFDSGNRGLLRFDNKAMEQQIDQLSSGLSARGELLVEILGSDRAWTLKTSPTQFLTSLENLRFHRVNPITEMKTTIPKIEINSDYKIQLEAKDLSEINRPQIKEFSAKNSIEITPFHFQMGLEPKTMAFDLGQEIYRLNATWKDQLEVALEGSLKSLSSPQFLKKPIPMAFSSITKFGPELKSASTKSQFKVAATEIFGSEFESTHDLQKFFFAYQGKGLFQLPVSLKQSVPQLAVLSKMGSLTAPFKCQGSLDGFSTFTSDWTTDLAPLKLPSPILSLKTSIESKMKWLFADWKLESHSKIKLETEGAGVWSLNNLLNFTYQKVETADWKTGFLTDGETSIAAISPPKLAIPVQWDAPLVFRHNVSAPPEKKLQVDLELALAAIGVKGAARIEGTKAFLKMEAPSLSKISTGFNFDAGFSQEKIIPEQKVDGKVFPIEGLKFEAKSHLENGRLFSLDSLKGSMNGDLLSFNLSANGNLSNKNFQAQGNFAMKVPSRFPEFFGQKFSGSVAVPINIAISGGKEMVFEATTKLENLNWKMGPYAFSDLNGQVPLKEKLIWDGKNIRFKSLIVQNAFERVDFERVRPLLSGSEQVRLAQIKWEEKTYGPFIGFFSAQQNMLRIHQFDMDLGSGRAYGEMFIDFYPSNLQFGFLGRLTSLNLNEFLPAVFLKKQPPGDKNLSARAGFVLNLKRSSLDGRMDVTEVGGPQLISLINVVDPNYEDEKMNKMRTLLGIGYPTNVNIAFAEGYMDMNLGITALGINKQYPLNGIPISGLLSKATAGFLKTAEKGPLQ